MDIYIYQQILVLEYWNLANPLEVSMQEFFVKFFFGLDLNLHLYLMVWLEIEHLHIAATTFARDFKLDQFMNFLRIFVWLELSSGHYGLTWKWTFTYISKYLCYSPETWQTPWGYQCKNFLWNFFLVWLELNIFGSTWTCTCT